MTGADWIECVNCSWLAVAVAWKKFKVEAMKRSDHWWVTSGDSDSANDRRQHNNQNTLHSFPPLSLILSHSAGFELRHQSETNENVCLRRSEERLQLADWPLISMIWWKWWNDGLPVRCLLSQLIIYFLNFLFIIHIGFLFARPYSPIFPLQQNQLLYARVKEILIKKVDRCADLLKSPAEIWNLISCNFFDWSLFDHHSYITLVV